MADTTPAAFDPKPKHLGTCITCIAGGTILAGSVVGPAATGVSNTVIVSDTDTSAGVFGVAMESAATGDYFAVMGVGTVCLVCEGKGSGIDAGDFLQTCDIGGCVKTFTVAAAGEAVGIALEDIAANGTGYAMISPFAFGKGA
jgi:hypothetical protein